MYKLICSNLIKSHRSLTNFTGYYRKVARKYYRSTATGKKQDSETDLHNKQAIEEKTQPAECQEEIVESQVSLEDGPYTSFLEQNQVEKTYKCPSTEKCRIAGTSVSSRLFHTSSVNKKHNNPPTKRPFKSKEAQEYYQTAIEQCMRIKYKLAKFYQQAGYAVKPPQLINDLKKEYENAALAKKLDSLKTIKKKQKAEIKKRVVAPELTKIAHMKNVKGNNQFKECKFKISYPTHTMRYKLGTYKLQHKIKQQVVTNNELKTILKDPIREPAESVKIKHQQATERERAEIQEMKYKQHQKRLPYIAQYLQQYGIDENSEEIMQRKKLEQSTIRQHPTVRQANVTVKMAFKSSYNKLLKKSGLVYQGPKEKDMDVEDTMKHKDGDGRKQLEGQTPPPAPEPQTWMYTKTEESKERDNDLKVMEHPLAGTKPVTVEPTPKHPKRILSDKSEIFDIDAVCLKSNSASNVTTNYGDYVVESDERVKNFVKAYKHDPRRPRNESKTKLEAKETTDELREESKDVSKVESISDYLKKLKELRDQTAVDRMKLRKFGEPKKLDMMQTVESKRIIETMRKFEEQKIDESTKKSDTQQTDKLSMKNKFPFSVGDDRQTGKKKDIKPKLRAPVDDPEVKHKQYPISDKFAGSRDTDLYPIRNETTSREKIIRRLKPYEDKMKSKSVLNLKKEKSPLKRVSSLKSTISENISKSDNFKQQSPADTRTIEARVTSSTGSINISEQELKKPRDTLAKIMERYMVQSKKTMSMAEIKRINRRKRKAREMKLVEEVKFQQKKLEENERNAVREEKRAVVKNIEKKYKYRLDAVFDSVDASKKKDIKEKPSHSKSKENISRNALQVNDKLQAIKEVSKEDSETTIVLEKGTEQISKVNSEKDINATLEAKENSEQPRTRTTEEPNLKMSVQSLLKEQRELKGKKNNLKKNIEIVAHKKQSIENTEVINKAVDVQEIHEVKASLKVNNEDVKEKQASENTGKLPGVREVSKEEKPLENALEKVSGMKKSFQEKKENLMKGDTKIITKVVKERQASENTVKLPDVTEVSKGEKPFEKTLEKVSDMKKYFEEKKENLMKDDVSKIITKDVKEKQACDNMGKLSDAITEESKAEKPIEKALEKVADMKRSLEEKKENLMKLVSTTLQQKKDKTSVVGETNKKITEEKENITPKGSLKLLKAKDNLNKKEVHKSEDVKKTENKILEDRKVLEDFKKSIKEEKSNFRKPVNKILEHKEKEILKAELKKLTSKTSKEKESSENLITRENGKRSSEMRLNRFSDIVHVPSKAQKISEDSLVLEKVADQKIALMKLKQNVKKSLDIAQQQKVPQVLKEAGETDIQRSEQMEKKVVQRGLEKGKSTDSNLKISTEQPPKENLQTSANQVVKTLQRDERTADVVSQQQEKKKPKEKWPSGFKSFKQRTKNRKIEAKNEHEHSKEIQQAKKENRTKDELYRTQLENLRKLKDASTKIVKLVENIDLKLVKEEAEEKSTTPENRPTIRKEKPDPKKEKQKKEQPKSRPDIVLPSKGQNEPKMQSEANTISCFEVLKRDIVEEINKELRSDIIQKHGLVSLEKIKKCKSLADLASEQKAKILKEIEDTWNEEKAKAMKKYKMSKSETGLNSLEGKKELRTSEEIKEQVDQKKKAPLLIIKLRYPSLSINSSDNKTKENLQMSKKGDGGLKTEASAISHSLGAKKSLRVNIEGNYPSDTGNKHIHPSSFYFPKTKRARIEDDILKIEAIPENKVGFVPKDVLWRTQNDLDVCFMFRKKGRIEDDQTATDYVKKVPRAKSVTTDLQKSANNMEGSTNLSSKRTASLNEIKLHGPEVKLRKIESISKNVTWAQKPISEKKDRYNSGVAGNTKTYEHNPGPTESTTTPVKNVNRISGKGKDDTSKKEPKLQDFKKTAEEPNEITKESTFRPMKKKFKVIPVKKKHVKSATKIELKKDHCKSFASKSKMTSLQLNGGRLNKTKSAQSINKKNIRKRDKVEKVSEPKILVNKDFQTKNNIKKLIEAMKKADKELEEILKSYQVPKKPSEVAEKKNKDQAGNLRKERTEVIAKKAKLREKTYKNSIDSKTYVLKNDFSKIKKNKSETDTPTKTKLPTTANNMLSRRQSLIDKKESRPKEKTNTIKKRNKYLLATVDQKSTKEVTATPKQPKKIIIFTSLYSLSKMLAL